MDSQPAYKSRLKQIKETLSPPHQEEPPTKLTKVMSASYLRTSKACSPTIIIEKHSARRNTNKTQSILAVPEPVCYSPRLTSKTQKIQVQKFEPIEIPHRSSKKLDNFSSNLLNMNKSQEIDIRIEENNKECIKKLFKKMYKLTEDLAQSQKTRGLLELELKNRKGVQERNEEHSDIINKLEIENHKLKLEIQNLKEKLAYEKLKPSHVIERLVDKPIEIIKQVPIEKIVEVKVEVPKYILGPERIVEKIVEVPKYIEVDKPSHHPPPQIQVRQVIKTVPEIIEKPVYIDKPIYIDKPVYVEKIVEKRVEVPVQVPIEVPIYINQNNQAAQAELQTTLLRVTSLEQKISGLTLTNQTLRLENQELLTSIEILKRHNGQKNRQLEGLLRSDYENRRGISIIREMSGLPSSQFSSSLHQGYSLTAQNFSPSTVF